MHGTRGSIPSPGPSTVRFGGNTTCVSVEWGDDAILVLDAGSGIRALGEELWDDDREIILLLTHVHWDHVQGFPFFKPLYQPGRKVSILLPESDWVHCLRQTMDGTFYFPMDFDNLPSDRRFISEGIPDFLATHGLSMASIQTNHPGLCFGYRIERNGQSVVFMPDNEIVAPVEHTSLEKFAAFSRDADLLIHDGQYTEADLPAKQGWGHSTPGMVAQLANRSGARKLTLTHHDPNRSDAEVERIAETASQYLLDLGSKATCAAAAEGDQFQLGPDS
ncbi:MAG: phosphoribosyl 1,2-cyclic phosphodiesterase [Rhodothermales bacterium]|jgi:phosphoribosyl 1,2-cyclic phosphodiesterase